MKYEDKILSLLPRTNSQCFDLENSISNLGSSAEAGLLPNVLFSSYPSPISKDTMKSKLSNSFVSARLSVSNGAIFSLAYGQHWRVLWPLSLSILSWSGIALMRARWYLPVRSLHRSWAASAKTGNYTYDQESSHWLSTSRKLDL